MSVKFKHVFMLEQPITVTEYSMSDENQFSSLLYHTTHYSYKRQVYQWTNLRQLCFWAYRNLPSSESYLCKYCYRTDISVFVVNSDLTQNWNYMQCNDTYLELHWFKHDTTYYQHHSTPIHHPRYGTKPLRHCARKQQAYSHRKTHVQILYITHVYHHYWTIMHSLCVAHSGKCNYCIGDNRKSIF
jgi:hypothetical protein